MATINELYAWKDPGFTDGSVEVPKLSSLSTLPPYDWFNLTEYSSDFQFNPSKGRLFGELKIKVPYLTAKDWSYLKIVLSFNNPGASDPFTFYAFVDSVEVESDTVNYPMCIVRFHIDFWRTYAGSAVYGAGLVTRRPRGTDDPIQNVPARYRRVSETVFSLIPETIVGGLAYWAIINYTYEPDDSSHDTKTRIIVCPVAKTPNTIFYMRLSASSTVYRVPTLNQWLLGQFDEIFHITPSAISSVFLSPVPPLKLNSGTGTVSDPFVVVGSTPSPDPHTQQYAGQDMRYPASCSSSGFTLSDGTSGGFNDWPNNTVRTCMHCLASGNNWLSTISGSVVDQNGDVIIQTQFNSDAKISALPVDEYMRAVLGDTVFENLANGDTVTFGNIYGLYQSGSLRQWTESSGGGLLVAVTMYWRATMGPAVPSNTVLTYNNGTFGSYWVVVNGTISTSNVTLTTYTEATTTADYGFETANYDGADYAYLYTKTNKCAEYASSLTNEIRTTDTEEYVLTDLDGSIIGSLPWGLAVQDYTFRCIISATSAYVQFRFDGLNSGAEGLQFTVPLPALDISSNSWSEYLYSGQREYDVEQRRVARERGLVEGLAGSLASGATGAMLGGLKESQTDLPTYRSTRNAVLFGGLGAGAGLAGSALNYAVAGHYNDVLQSAEDMLRARQIDSLITAGNACDWLYYGRPYQIRSLVPDTYSLDRFDEDVALNGLKVSEPTASCDTLIRNASGPLAVENLVVRGNIPVEAKQYLKQKINDGVRLI